MKEFKKWKSLSLQKRRQMDEMIKIQDTKRKMDDYRLLPDNWGQQNSTPSQDDDWGTSIFATRSLSGSSKAENEHPPFPFLGRNALPNLTLVTAGPLVLV